MDESICAACGKIHDALLKADGGFGVKCNTTDTISVAFEGHDSLALGYGP